MQIFNCSIKQNQHNRKNAQILIDYGRLKLSVKIGLSNKLTSELNGVCLHYYTW